MADPDNPLPPPPPGKGAEEPPGRERKPVRRPARGRPFRQDTWAGFGWVNAACWLLLVVLAALWLLFWR